MTTILSHDAFHESVGHAFNELLALEQISRLPAESLLRVLKSIPEPLLQQALGNAPAKVSAPEPARPQIDERPEMRAFPRRKVLRGGTLVLNRGATTLDVQVRDISEGGCRIRTGNPALLPAVFSIRIVGFPGERACEVRWRGEREAGLRFVNG